MSSNSLFNTSLPLQILAVFNVFRTHIVKFQHMPVCEIQSDCDSYHLDYYRSVLLFMHRAS